MGIKYFNEETGLDIEYDHVVEYEKVKKATRLWHIAIDLENRAYDMYLHKRGWGPSYKYRQAMTLYWSNKAEEVYDEYRRVIADNKVCMYSWAYPKGHNDCIESITRLY